MICCPLPWARGTAGRACPAGHSAAEARPAAPSPAALSAKDQEKFTEMLIKWLLGICAGVPVYVLR